MKDLKISIVILLILAVLFSVYGVMPEMETHGDGTRERGEVSTITQGMGDEQVQTNTEEKTNIELAYEVIRGEWNNGYTRKQLMWDAGHDYSAVQKIVNDMLK